MRLLVCGGRDYTDRQRLYFVMNMMHLAEPISCVITGGANGADRLAAEWALDHNIDLEVYQANWTLYGRQFAGTIRNQRMLSYGKPDAVLAFPGGSGTADMIYQAQNVAVKVHDSTLFPTKES